MDYYNKNNLNPIKFIEDTAIGNITWQDRIIGQIMEKATTGDIIVVSEISRLGRSILQVLEILEADTKKRYQYIQLKNHIVINGSIQSMITVLQS